MIDLSALAELTEELREEGEYTQQGCSVLVVDDDFSTRWTLRGVLRRKGCVVGAASTGREALEMVQEGEYDVVLIDLKLPDMSGLDVEEALNRLSPETAAIFITAFVDEYEEGLERACQRDQRDVLFKPLELDSLVEMVREINQVGR